jgi:hypothetical protein
VAAVAWSQVTVKVDFGAPGKRQVWIGEGLPTSPPKDVTFTQGASLELKAPQRAGRASVFVLDESSGNLAEMPLSEIGAGWKVEPEDFRLIGRVIVRLEHKGLRVEAASVTVSDGERSQTSILDRFSGGELHFWAVRPGPVKVRTLYKSGDATAAPFVVTFDVPLEREEATPTLVVTIPGEVATIPPESDESSVKGAPGPESKFSGGPLGMILALLLTLVVVIGAALGALILLRRNSDRVRARLKALGVEVPEPADASLDAAPPSPVAPQPQQQILLDDAVPPPTQASAPVSKLAPRLVAESGKAIDLIAEVTEVGREVASGIRLAGESSVSRRHALIELRGTAAVVRDLNSTNGTFVNGVKIAGEAPLNPGDWVQFGAVRFRFEA